MRAVDLIRRKRDGGGLEPAQIEALIRGVTDGSIPDYQLAAFLMAVFWRGMSPEETTELTRAMARSGARLDLSDVEGVKADKHSTGGVGDKISLVLAPLAAACGLKVPMMSGRALGHTGGTVDKLESIPGFRCHLSLAEVKTALRRVGCAMVGQTGELAPADRRLYALRDVTGTVESVPLITASILSKKIAEGIEVLVLDVKVGRGAFMTTLETARELAGRLIEIGTRAGLRVEALLTAMDTPLGWSVGNSLEVAEAIQTLKGRGAWDVTELSVRLTSRMVRLGGLEATDEAADRRVDRALASGAALEKLREIVANQGGDPAVVDDETRLPQAPIREPLKAPEDGYVAALDARCFGEALGILGGGRARADQPIDPRVGIRLLARRGDRVARRDPMLEIHAADASRAQEAHRLLVPGIRIEPTAPAAPSLVLESAG